MMISEPVLVVAVPAGASEAHLRLSKALRALAVPQFRSPLIRRSSTLARMHRTQFVMLLG